ncbi:MAG TPA: PPC domain-containing DNA-binding protein [Hyphomicrobiaceae bacterium]|nr:PPC domain-containing DNA-binding protein [Hyphomicrobiaceae bacterium]
MQSKLLHEEGGQRTFALILQTGDEAMGCLQSFAESERLKAAQLTAIGAFERARIAYFDWEAKRYVPIPITQQVEVASLIGDVAVADGKPSVHVHAVLGRRDGSAMAGHLQEGHVRPTLEAIITEQPAHLRKVKDAETGLALIRPRL